MVQQHVIISLTFIDVILTHRIDASLARANIRYHFDPRDLCIKRPDGAIDLTIPHRWTAEVDPILGRSQKAKDKVGRFRHVVRAIFAGRETDICSSQKLIDVMEVMRS